MIIHYSVPVSLYCAKTRILMRHKALAFEDRAPAGGYGSNTYKALIPSGNLPAIDDDGFLLADSEAIAEYLEEKHPVPAMLPHGLTARARVRERARFHDTRLEPALRALFPLVGPEEPAPEVTAPLAIAINARLAQLGRMLDADAGERLTLGDCGYPPTFLWIDRLGAEFNLSIAYPDRVQAYRARLEAQFAVAEEMALYRNNLDPWIDKKRAG